MYRLKLGLLGLALAVMTTGIALAQQPAYSINRWSFGSRGASAGGGYLLGAIAGQAEVTAPLTGGTYILVGGFGSGANSDGTLGEPGCTEGKPCVFLPLVAGGQ